MIADVFDVVLIDNATGDVAGSTTLQQANIEVSVSEVEVRAGKGNQLIGLLHVSRDIALNLTDAVFKYDWLAKQLGQDITTGAGVGYAMPTWHTAVNDSGVKITLAATPISTTPATAGIAIFDASGVLIPTANYTMSGAVVTFTSGVSADDEVEVRTYKYNTSASTQTIEIDNSIFAKGVTCILETIEIDGDENPTHTLQYQFTSCVPTGNFSINTQSEKQAATQEFGLKVVKPKTSTLVGKVLRIPIA